MLGRTPEEVATFLAKTEGLDKTLIGDYLGEREDFNLKVMHAFVDALDFAGLEFDTAIRTFLQVSSDVPLATTPDMQLCR
jgi:brefeldin A-inhibited guanine nucleotide-exchange protein